MTDFRIEYNPYLIAYSFYKNGCKINPQKIASKSNQRLQAILLPAKNWDGLIAEIARVCNETIIRITFKGRKIDFDDLLYGVDAYTGPVKFECVLEEVKSEDEILAELDKVIAEIKSRNLSQFSQVDDSGRSVFDAYEEAKNGIFEVSVIATMSSGKSTLINSLLHTELLPSENKACTATIARIFDNDQIDGYEAECYGGDGTVVYSRAGITSDLLRSYNADESVQEIIIEGRIPSIKEGKIKLCLVDTPGPNNSRNENHGRLTRSIIKNPDSVILYVMNATQIGINDDHQLLLDISSQMKRAGKQSRDRFIFVINKCDELDVEKGETIDKLLNEIRQYLLGFGIEDPLLIPTSARLALLIRKSRNGEMLSRKERAELNGAEDFLESELLYFERYATVTPSVRAELTEQIEELRSNEALYDLEILVHTGVPVVEAVINEYINKYAYPIKINDAVKNILNLLSELNMKGSFEQRIANDSALLERVRIQIQEAKNNRDKGKAISREFKNRIKALKFSSIDCDEEQFKVELELQALSKEYDGKEFVDKSIAEGTVREFLRRLEKFQKDCESRLQREIDEQIFKKCSELLEEYEQVVSAILSDLEIECFDFKRISSFGAIKTKRVTEIISENEQTRYRQETRWKDNPERAGFWGFFMFWKPKKVSYTESVEDGTDVNIKKVIVDILDDFTQEMKRNISQMFVQAKTQIHAYQQAFYDNIDRLDIKIDEILEQLESDVLLLDETAVQVNSDKELLEWFLDIEKQIKALLSV